ncbi:MAG TPA: mechanosensitive ion channel family protein [Acetobacteraceae bacterium]|nr:mechanosensitive ion channel family protein [Acetobacteraceae bacterium]
MRSFPMPMLCLAAVLAAALPASGAAASPADPSAGPAARAAQLRDLLGTEQGAAILDLLGDPQVRQALLHDAAPPAPGSAQNGSAGQMMDAMLGDVRARLRGIASGLVQLPGDLADVWANAHSALPGAEALRLIGSLVLFLAGGIAAQRLFYHLARPWRAHFDTLTLATPRQRIAVVAERVLFAVLMIGAFAAGSMGAFLMLSWPPLTGSIILGYLLAFIAIRLAMTASRFFLAPGAERLRLVPASTETAWFWHRWTARLTGVAALGWQTVMTLRALGLSAAESDVLRQLVLLLLAALGIVLVWAIPASDRSSAHQARGLMLRLLASIALLLDWLLFLMGETALAETLLILAAAPAVAFVLSRAAAMVLLGRWPEQGGDRSAHLAIAERAVQTVVVLLAAMVLMHVWQIDMTMMSNMDTPMTRIARGVLEALVILVVADLLWQAVRLTIDTRLANDGLSADELDDDARRRRTRLHTLLPVLRNFAMFVVLVMATLSALAAMGLQIGPLLAGAGVVGIAVGFGAQTLVRDILSGVFFLLDDAFRVGEQIESGGIRGMVESFSLRSVKLRHFNGQLHTVPFGDLKAITNYSRDWVVENVQLVVSYDTDLDRLDSVVEEVSEDLRADPAMASEMIEPLRSLGAQAMLDTGIQVGLTFKTRPGRQFMVRRAVLARINVAFAIHGIRFANAPAPQQAASASTV